MNITNMKLHAFCNGCGELMRDMGEWPVQFPRQEGVHQGACFTLQARRFVCKTCRTPSDKYEKGYPVIISIVDNE